MRAHGNLDCFLLSETLTTEALNITIKGYTFLKRNIPTRGGGVIIIMNNKYFLNDICITNNNIEVVAVTSKTGNKIISIAPIYLFHIYLPPNNTITNMEIDNELNRIPRPRIIEGDFNYVPSNMGII